MSDCAQVSCAEALLETIEEELTCDRLITSARKRDASIADKLVDKVLNIVRSKHGPWGDKSEQEKYVKQELGQLQLIYYVNTVQ